MTFSPRRTRRLPLAPLCAALLLLGAGPGQAGELRLGSGSTWQLGGGRLDLGCGDLTVAGSFTVEGGKAVGIRDLRAEPGASLDGGSGLLSLSGDWDAAAAFLPGTGRVALVDGCGLASAQVLGDGAFHDLLLSSESGRLLAFEAGSTTTVSGLFRALGVPEALLRIRSTLPGVAAQLDVGPAQQVAHVDVDDNHAVGQRIAYGEDSVVGPNTLGWILGVGVPLLGPLGAAALAAGLLASGLRSGRFGRARA